MSTATPTPQSPMAEPPRGGGALYVAGLASVVLAFAGVFLISSSRRSAEAQEGEARKADVAAGPLVRVATVQVSAPDRSVTLPGEVKAYAQATLYAKVSGYLKEIKVDKGDRVKGNQLLATLESPDADQQVAAAEADLENKKQLASRARELSKSGVMSRQDEENTAAAQRLAEAALARARATRSYTEIRAPFAGVVTTRYADPGALLPAATGSTQSAQPVVDVADIDRLRIYVYLGQDDAALVREGDPAKLTVDAMPGESIDAKVTRLSRSLDPRTRTMLCEIDIDNRAGTLYPGEFVHVALSLRARSYAMVPVESLIIRGEKVMVAVVKDGHAHLTPVTLGADDGKVVQVVKGLAGGEQVALNAAAEVVEGAPVRVAPLAAAAR